MNKLLVALILVFLALLAGTAFAEQAGAQIRLA
jgi:hypothetical protein